MAVIIKSDPIARSKPCLRCGYSLRKIVDSRNCPECGLSIWLSLNGSNALDLSNPQWLRHLARGSMLMSAAQVPIVIILVMMLTQQNAMASLLFVAIGLHLLIHCGGLLLLLNSEGCHPDTSRTLRRFGRFTSFLGAIIGLWLLFLALDRSPGEVSQSFAASGIGTSAVILSALITWLYLKRLARRLKDPNRAIVRICGYMILVTLLPVAKAVMVGDYFLIVWFEWLVARLPWVYFPCAAGLFAWFARAFLQAARVAERHWALETEAPSVATSI